jgi:hypothetical protein
MSTFRIGTGNSQGVANVEQATEIAMQQAKRAGLPVILVTVSSVKKNGEGDWEAVLDWIGSGHRYKAIISREDGSIKEWAEIDRPGHH